MHGTLHKVNVRREVSHVYRCELFRLRRCWKRRCWDNLDGHGGHLFPRMGSPRALEKAQVYAQLDESDGSASCWPSVSILIINFDFINKVEYNNINAI